MKGWLTLALVVCVATALQAGESEKKGEGKKGHGKGTSKEQFVAQQKRMAKKKGKEFDQAKAEKRFNKLDANKDGKLSADEKPQGKGKGKGKGKDKGKNKSAE
jgi:hypothetical protein